MYKTLDKLPIKTYFLIEETGDINLLLFEGEKCDENELNVLWLKLQAEFSDLAQDPEDKKSLRILKEVKRCETKHQLIDAFCVCLDFDWDEEMVQILRNWGYVLTEENYYEDLEKIKRESEGLLIKAENLKKLLPKSEESGSNVTIDDVLASHSSILGFDFDYETISCKKYLAHKKQIDVKMKHAEAEFKRNNIRNNTKRNG